MSSLKKNYLNSITDFFYLNQDILVATIDILNRGTEDEEWIVHFYVRACSDKSFKKSIDPNIKASYLTFDERYKIQENNHDFILDKEGFIESLKHKKFKRQKNGIQYPIPEHLEKIFEVDGSKQNSENEVNGRLCCECGGTQFVIHLLDNKEGTIDGSYCKAICSKCNKPYLVFDAYIHGWDGYICKAFGKREKELKLSMLKCNKCSSNLFSVSITIASQGPEDFKREIDDSSEMFKEKDWVNAFDHIVITFQCNTCGDSLKDYIDYETM